MMGLVLLLYSWTLPPLSTTLAMWPSQSVLARDTDPPPPPAHLSPPDHLLCSQTSPRRTRHPVTAWPSVLLCLRWSSQFLIWSCLR